MFLIALAVLALGGKASELYGPELIEPTIVDFTKNIGTQDFIVKYSELEIKNRSGITLVKFWTRLYCYKDKCTLPGPTWIMRPNVPAVLRLCNALTGFGLEHMTEAEVERLGYTPYKNQDVVNLHVHGLHVNPDEDDVLGRIQNPFCPKGVSSKQGRECVEPNADRSNYACTEYNFTLPGYHFPGSHWWHTHLHGSVELQVSGGLYGGIIVEKSSAEKTMESSWLFAHYFVGMIPGTCSPNSCTKKREPKPGGMFGLKDQNGNQVMWERREGGFPLPTRCHLQCYYSTEEKMASGLNQEIYNPHGVNHELFLVNGQMEPTKTLQTGKWHRFRIVMTSGVYLFLKVPDTSDCDFYLLGNDGIDFTPATNKEDGYDDGTGPRNIREKPYFGTIVLPIGSRADVAIRCRKAGRYELKALSAPKGGPFNKDPASPSELTISDAFSAENKAALSELYNTSVDCQTGNLQFWMPTARKDLLLLDLKVVGPDDNSVAGPPPLNNPAYKDSLYLVNTRTVVDPTVDVSQPNVATAMRTANIVFPSRPFRNTRDHPELTNFSAMATGMNNVSFHDVTPMYTIQSGVTHEWTVYIRYHPFHQHTWPYQVLSGFPDWTGHKIKALRESTGWWVRHGDWRDTLGIYGSLVVRVNYVASGPDTSSFLKAKLVIHCHFVFHEDFGMMQWYQMTPKVQDRMHYKIDSNFTVGEKKFWKLRNICANQATTTTTTPKPINNGGNNGDHWHGHNQGNHGGWHGHDHGHGDHGHGDHGHGDHGGHGHGGGGHGGDHGRGGGHDGGRDWHGDGHGGDHGGGHHGGHGGDFGHRYYARNINPAQISSPVIRAGRVLVKSSVLDVKFRFELGQLSNDQYYAVFDGWSRTNVHNFHVTYAVSANDTRKCGVKAHGIAMRLQVYKNDPTMDKHKFQAIPVDINPPHREASVACLNSLNFTCEAPIQQILVSKKQPVKFWFRLICGFQLPSTRVCGTSADFKNVFVTSDPDKPFTKPFSWTYGEGVGSSDFPEYQNQNVQTCPITMRRVPVREVFTLNSGTAIETVCNYHYFNLVNKTQREYDFSLCSAIRGEVPTDAHERSHNRRRHVGTLVQVVLIGCALITLILCMLFGRRCMYWFQRRKYENLEKSSSRKIDVPGDEGDNECEDDEDVSIVQPLKA